MVAERREDSAPIGRGSRRFDPYSKTDEAVTDASMSTPTLPPGEAGSTVEIVGSSTGDRIYRGMTTAFALLVPVLLILTAYEVVVGGWPALSKFGLGFFTRAE